MSLPGKELVSDGEANTDFRRVRAVPKDRVYRSTKKRNAANLAYPQKANAVRRSTADSSEKAYEQSRNVL
jgi:hypothetical protein